MTEASGLDLFEGDIKINEKNARNSINGDKYRWPLTVPYYLEDSLEMNAKGIILKAFERYRLKTCINFTPWNGEQHYISVFKDKGCYSSVGNRQCGKQQLSIGLDCDTVEIVQHEFLHALGFDHEHSRSDRDDYLSVVWENIQPGKEDNFKLRDDKITSFLNVPYDYTSIMHYAKTIFGNGRDLTMIPKNPQFINIMGRQMDLSDSDVLKLNRLYNCSSSLTFLESCSFELDDICGMLQKSDDANWQRLFEVTNGPSSDHTTLGKVKDYGYFMHFSTSTGKTGDKAILGSRLFYPVRGFQCLEFFYYLSGNANDRMNIWIAEYTDESPNGALTFIDSVNGEPADYWQLHHSSLNATHKFRFILQGIKGDGNSNGGFSIDDINLSETECPQNVWHIRNFTENWNEGEIFSPPYYSKDGYAYQIALRKYAKANLSFSIATYLYLTSGANDYALQWPCPWRQATIEFLDKHPNAQQRTSNMKSITTDPSQRSKDNTYKWDNPSVVGKIKNFPNGTVYKQSGGYGKFLFRSEDWLYRRDFLKGGDAFILVSMEDISHLNQSQPLPQSTIPPVPVLCKENICENNGLCLVEDFKIVCRCITSGDWWYVGDRCERRVPSKGHVWTMTALSPPIVALFTLMNSV
ncbi:meprin A subunit beta-like [Mixophyes fleayi]|uniref:meprin A subunit beta-like n=1 Tax=Mixophyes fleayi TaxID=3061075 RepID=UPI003F4DAE6A